MIFQKLPSCIPPFSFDWGLRLTEGELALGVLGTRLNANKSSLMWFGISFFLNL
jgi:hypothetical protein